MNGFETSYEWEGTSSDPNDEQFGHLIVPATLETAENYQFILIGEPYDGAVIGRKGAREAPVAIREVLAGTKTHHLDLGGVGSIGDLGDLKIPSEEPVKTVQTTIEEVVQKIHPLDSFPVFLGGDNSLTVPNVSPLLEPNGRVGVISLDTHFDCREVFEGPSSGTPYRQLFGKSLDRLAILGASHFENSRTYHEYVQEKNCYLATPESIREDIASVIEATKDYLNGMDVVYLSLDCDVLDITAGPGVSAPTPGGITSRELFIMLEEFGTIPNLAGFEIVECSPPLDSNQLTVVTAAKSIAHLLAGVQHG